MPQINGGCYCGNIRLDVSLSRELSEYSPRACDCDFCQKHGSAYVSDPRGSLRIRVGDEREVSRFRQGSNTAQMLVCRTCGVLVGALYQDGERLFGTLNARALDCHAAFGVQKTVSPKSLSADVKAQRWRDIWFADVAVTRSHPEQP